MEQRICAVYWGVNGQRTKVLKYFDMLSNILLFTQPLNKMLLSKGGGGGGSRSPNIQYQNTYYKHNLNNFFFFFFFLQHCY